jgi:hypothetical protein
MPGNEMPKGGMKDQVQGRAQGPAPQPVREEVSIRAHFERFPATVKGAFVLRAAARNPHQVKILSARVVELAGHGGMSIDLEPVTLEVAPRLDLFVPFEFATSELGPGWYALECEVTIDGIGAVVRPGKRFPIAWPRATVRRGTLPVGKSVTSKGVKVRLDQVECTGDSIKVVFESSQAPTLKLSADGVALTPIAEEFDAEAGRGRVTAYPLMRSQRRLTIEVRGSSKPVVVQLP